MRIPFAALLAVMLPGIAWGERNTVIDGNNGTMPLPTGQYVTPLLLTNAVQQPLEPGLPAYPGFGAGMAVASRLSPDGATLAVLCAGMNSLRDRAGVTDVANSTQYVFLYDVAGANRTRPLLRQVIKQANAFVGLVWGDDDTLYAAGGVDDAVHVYARAGGVFVRAARIALGHADRGIGLKVRPNAGGLAVSADGRTLVVANNYNDSISVIDTATRTVRYEHDLRPFANEGVTAAGGTFPYAVVIRGDATAYVSSDRDREVMALDISAPGGARLVSRIKLAGNGLGMALNADQTRLYVAQDNTDTVAVIDTADNVVLRQIDARAPAGLIEGAQTGASTASVTLSPDGATLYAVNAGANAVAVIPLSGPDADRVAGLIPTAYEPHDLTFSADGSWMYIVNGKSETGPNAGHRASAADRVGAPAGGKAVQTEGRAANQYQFQLERATLVSGKVPSPAELPSLTAQVALNNGYGVAPVASDVAVMAALRERIRHVIYVIKENRTFDQVLGDLRNGADADPALAMFGEPFTPNFHAMARRFVTLDNVMDPGDGSMDGWSWSLAGRVTTTEAITQQINYAFVRRGLSYESEGENRGVPVGLGTLELRDAAKRGQLVPGTADLPGGAANVLVGPGNHAATDAPFGIQNGTIFDAVLAAGKTVRNYGMLTANVGGIGTKQNPVSDPFKAGVPQVAALNPSLVDRTDLYFRGYDQSYPDLWRYNEWKREFDGFVAGGDLPALSLVRLSHDHTGSFATALAGVDTPETQQADNDLSVGLLIQAVAHSRYAADTVIFVIEDDCQDGPDHVDSHRTTAYAVGAYVRQGAVISTRYNQVSLLRTIEDLLGTQHINLNTAYQRPMADVFDPTASPDWSFTAVASRVLASTRLGIAEAGIPFAGGADVAPRHDAAYWVRETRGFDFSDADRVPPDLYNEVLWEGLMPGAPYPSHRSGRFMGRTEPAGR